MSSCGRRSSPRRVRVPRSSRSTRRSVPPRAPPRARHAPRRATAAPGPSSSRSRASRRRAHGRRPSSVRRARSGGKRPRTSRRRGRRGAGRGRRRHAACSYRDVTTSRRSPHPPIGGCGGPPSGGRRNIRSIDGSAHVSAHDHPGARTDDARHRARGEEEAMDMRAHIGPRRTNSIGTSAVKLAWGTWRVSIGRIPPSDLDLTRAYDRASARWSLMSAILGYSRAYPELFAQLRSDGWLDQSTSGTCVLDCGTGTGVLISALPPDLARSLCIHGVDRSSGMLARAATELDSVPSPVELHRADIRRLPFPAGGFDVVMSAHVLEHLADPLDGLREMIRVLRPGGTLLLVTTRPSVPEAVLRLAWRYRTFNKVWLLHALMICGIARSRCYLVGQRPRIARSLSFAY